MKNILYFIFVNYSLIHRRNIENFQSKNKFNNQKENKNKKYSRYIDISQKSNISIFMNLVSEEESNTQITPMDYRGIVVLLVRTTKVILKNETILTLLYFTE